MVPLETKVPDTADAPRRADARRNRERVLAAAEAVFAESGVKAPVEEVARRAGVGGGTVGRNFPAQQARVGAASAGKYRMVVGESDAALDEPDPAHAL